MTNLQANIVQIASTDALGNKAASMRNSMPVLGPENAEFSGVFNALMFEIRNAGKGNTDTGKQGLPDSAGRTTDQLADRNSDPQAKPDIKSETMTVSDEFASVGGVNETQDEDETDSVAQDPNVLLPPIENTVLIATQVQKEVVEQSTTNQSLGRNWSKSEHASYTETQKVPTAKSGDLGRPHDAVNPQTEKCEAAVTTHTTQPRPVSAIGRPVPNVDIAPEEYRTIAEQKQRAAAIFGEAPSPIPSARKMVPSFREERTLEFLTAANRSIRYPTATKIAGASGGAEQIALKHISDGSFAMRAEASQPMMSSLDIGGREREDGFSQVLGTRIVGPIGHNGIQAVNQPELARHIGGQLAANVNHVTAGQTDITLNPIELGRVRLALQVGDNGITLAVFADRPETADLMRRHVDILAQEFRSLGYETVKFTFSGHNGQQTGGRDTAQDHTSAHAADGSETVEAVMHVDRATPTKSGVDLRL